MTPTLPGALSSGQCQQGQSAKGKRMGILIFPESTTGAASFGYGGQIYRVKSFTQSKLQILKEKGLHLTGSQPSADVGTNGILC